MRVKPRTQYQWLRLVCEILKAVEKNATDSDLKELLFDCLVIIERPAAFRNSRTFFEKMDRLLDQVNGSEHETIGAKHMREFLAK